MYNNLSSGNYYITDTNNDYDDEIKNISIKNINKMISYNGKKWDAYRLGDTIGGKNHNLGSNLKNQIKLIEKKWPDSLIHKYFLLKQEKKITHNNIIELYKLLNEIKIIHTSTNFIAFHIRIGDGITWRSPLERYENIDMNKYGDTKTIIIFCGSHNCNGPPSSETKKYLRDVSNIFTKQNYTVFIRSGNSPDEDIYLMTKAKYFIPGSIGNKKKPCGGGYNGLVKRLRNVSNTYT